MALSTVRTTDFTDMTRYSPTLLQENLLQVLNSSELDCKDVFESVPRGSGCGMNWQPLKIPLDPLHWQSYPDYECGRFTIISALVAC